MIRRTEVYDTYWKVAAERQEIFFKKYAGEKPPYTTDPIFKTFKFCNTYRASDRVSQFLINKVIYSRDLENGSEQREEDTLFRIMLFRLLNKNETWENLEKILGVISLKTFSFELYDKTLKKLNEAGPVYGNAFILCANKVFGYDKKHQNHLSLLENIFKTDIHSKILKSKTLEGLVNTLKKLPLIGNFMSYQIAIDLNYSKLFDFDENDFTVAGPGAQRGIEKCFIDVGGNSERDVINYMVENQDREFARLGIKFKNLWGRPLKAIDCQSLFCEVDKYTRVKFPHLKSNRSKIKAKYNPNFEPIKYCYPPKWNINNHPICPPVTNIP